MTAPTDFEVMILVTALIVLTFGYTLVKFSWNQPLRNGSGFFWGIEVPEGFYAGPGRAWLRGYRTTLVVLHLVLVVVLASCFALRRWDLVPLWAGGFSLFYVPAIAAVSLWSRHKLGTKPPIRAVALSLESRRLGDYISWPIESLFAAIIATCWWIMLRHGPKFDWLSPLQMTWSAIVLPAKIALVRSGAPLPAERTEEHYRYQDAMRRNVIQVLNAMGWLMVQMSDGSEGGTKGGSTSQRSPLPRIHTRASSRRRIASVGAASQRSRSREPAAVVLRSMAPSKEASRVPRGDWKISRFRRVAGSSSSVRVLRYSCRERRFSGLAQRFSVA